jgi:hypothetical protein
METAREYRQYAEECLASAKAAESDEERDLFLRMAQDWLRAATLMETETTPASSNVRDFTP